MDTFRLQEVEILLASLEELKKNIYKYKANLSKEAHAKFFQTKSYGFGGELTSYPLGYNVSYKNEFFRICFYFLV